MRGATWLAVCLLCGCGGCDSGGASDGGPEPPAQEPRDEPDGSVEAGTDGAADASGLDASADAPPADAGPDPGPYPDADWVPMPGLPDGCVVERARRPEEVFVPEWEPCPEGLAGCEVLAFGPEDRERRFLGSRGSHDGERGYFVFSERPLDGSRLWVTVLAATNGMPPGAWRFPDASAGGGLCSVVRFGLEDDTGAYALNISGDPPPRQLRIYHARISELGSETDPEVVLDRSDTGGRFSQHVRTSNTTVGIELQPAGRVLIVEDGRAQLVEPTAEVAGAPQHVTVIGRQVLWEDWPGSPRVNLAQASFGESASMYLALDGADVKGFSADGQQMAWVQGYSAEPGDPYDRIELWTARHAVRPSDLEPRKVADLPVRPSGVLNGELYTYAAFLDGTTRLVIYSIDSGERTELTLPEPWIPNAGVLYVHGSEMLLGVSHPARGQTAMRIDIDTIL